MKGIGIVFPMGQSKHRLEEHGQWSLWEQEIRAYQKAFSPVHFFEYRHQGLLRFPESVSLPITQRKEFLECSVLKAVHLTGAIPCLIAHRLFRTPFLLNFGYRYDQFAELERRYLSLAMITLILPVAIRDASCVVVPTEQLETYVTALGARATAVIPNGVDTILFCPAKKKQRHYPRSITVLFVGRLERQKNLLELIYAVSTIRSLKRSIKLLFVGDGQEKQTLVSLASKLGIALTIQPFVSNEELPNFYRAASVFVLPSLLEGHPKALLEAMSCGLPVIATNIPGCRDIVTNGKDGLLVVPTGEGIQEGFKKILTDKRFSEKLGGNARQTILSKYDKKILLKKEIQLLYTVTGDR